MVIIKSRIVARLTIVYNMRTERVWYFRMASEIFSVFSHTGMMLNIDVLLLPGVQNV